MGCTVESLRLWTGLDWAGLETAVNTANIVMARTGCLFLGLKLLHEAVIASTLPFLHDDGNKKVHIAWLLTHFAASVKATSTLHARVANIS